VRVLVLFLVAAAAVPSAFGGDTSPTAKRDKALEGVNKCLKRLEVSSRECRKLNENIKTLIEVYKEGDKSVLPVLFHFTFLTDFYDEVLLSDRDGFLTAMSQLTPQEQRAVAGGVAGGTYMLPSEERFQEVRAALKQVPESSASQPAARMCLTTLETNNAAYFVKYFPPHTFTGRGADFQLYWYSRDMYLLGEKPLWPPASSDERVFRFTYLSAFTGPTVVTLTLQAGGTGNIAIKQLNPTSAGKLPLDETAVVSQNGITEFLARLDQAHFWDMPVESSFRGLDGAEWILEGVQDGKYHMVTRWCAGDDKDGDGKPFADAVRKLFELAGHKHYGSC